MNKLRIFSLTVCLILIFGSVLSIPCSANSAQAYWYGTDASGAAVTDEECPIVVEKEILTLDLGEFPRVYYDDADGYLAYSGKVTAEYHFYNPSDYTVTATLLFPFGKEPLYAAEYYDENGVRVTDVDTEKYGVFVNGDKIKAELRHSYLENYQVLNMGDYSLLPVEDDYQKYADFTPDYPVLACSYTVSGINSVEYRVATTALDIPKNGIQNGNALLYIPDQRCLRSSNDGYRVGVDVDNNGSFTVYILGSSTPELPSWTVYKDRGMFDGDEINGTVTLKETQHLTLYDLALTYWTEQSGVSKLDWYNAFIRQLINAENASYGLINAGEITMSLDSELSRWYKYEITLEPGERIVNRVEAPIYPDIDESYSPTVYSYTYLLSPAKTWNEFGEFEIRINTPYYVVDSSLGEFDKTKEGYTMHLDSLPRNSELELTISESENPERQRNAYESIFVALSMIAIGAGLAVLLKLVGIVVAIIAAIVIIVLVVRRVRKKRNHSKQQTD